MNFRRPKTLSRRPGARPAKRAAAIGWVLAGLLFGCEGANPSLVPPADGAGGFGDGLSGGAGATGDMAPSTGADGGAIERGDAGLIGPTTDADPRAPDAAIGAGDATRPPIGYHPEGYRDADVHGLELKLQAQDCRTCHGNTLEGGRGPSCDGCHVADWRTDCTYCHGGVDTATGAPPRDLRGDAADGRSSFSAHTAHTTAGHHIAWDCTQCHVKPADMLALNHVFDATPGAAEVHFEGGLSRNGRYEGEGRCGNLYCHGDGRTPGDASDRGPPSDCESCHPSRALGGRHDDHRGRDFTCADCHAATVDRQGAIPQPAKHVDGVVDVMLADRDMNLRDGRCSGSCHGEEHEGERW